MLEKDCARHLQTTTITRFRKYKYEVYDTNRDFSIFRHMVSCKLYN